MQGYTGKILRVDLTTQSLEVEEPEEPVCVVTSWTPSRDTKCIGDSVTQTSNCGDTRVMSGTDPCPASLSLEFSNIVITELIIMKNNCSMQ